MFLKDKISWLAPYNVDANCNCNFPLQACCSAGSPLDDTQSCRLEEVEPRGTATNVLQDEDYKLPAPTRAPSSLHHLAQVTKLPACASAATMAFCHAQASPALPSPAGFETTNTALGYCLYELARNPEVQQRLLAEVDTFGRDRRPEFEDLSSFPYTEAVFQEGLRMHTIVTPLYALVRSPASYCMHSACDDKCYEAGPQLQVAIIAWLHATNL